MATRTSNAGWIWFFVVLALLTVAAVATLVVFNLRQQLTPEKLAEAQALWKEKGPPDYDLEYTKEGSVSQHLHVEVRGGKVVGLTDDGRPLERRLYPSYDMAAVFGDLKRFLELKGEPGGGRKFLRAQFNADDGHVEKYVYSDPKTRQRIEVTIGLSRPEEAGPGGKSTR